MEKGITHVGLDAHKVSILVAVFFPGAASALEMECANDAASVRRMVRKVLAKAPGRVIFCYEAGPCGYALQRWIRALGVECSVVAPSLIPQKPGERVKTDRRDARKLGGLLRAGLLTEVHPPTEEDEAVRDLCRARDAHQDLVRCRHRLSKLVLRRGMTWEGGRWAWSVKNRAWLRGLRLEHAADQVVLDEYLLAIEQVEGRLKTLEERIEVASQEPR
jgi:transposase